MPSSTFNSDHPQSRAPEANWYFVWGLTIAITGIAVSVAESYWRNCGHRPSIVDSLELWAIHRSRVADNSRRRVVLIGASRIKLGFSTDTFRKKFPDHNLTQLAILGRWPVAVLRDLSEDERFRGIVVCSITSPAFRQSLWESQAEYVDYYHKSYVAPFAVGTIVRSFIQGQFVIRSPQVRLDRVLHNKIAGDPLPKPIYLVTRTDRSCAADFSLANIESVRQHHINLARQYSPENGPPSPKEWMTDVMMVETFVKRIHSRGGHVVFVRFPTTGEHWTIDERRFPRKNYWDLMAAFTSAETIHFADHPSLKRFECPDTSHLDAKDTPEFTDALLELLNIPKDQ